VKPGPDPSKDDIDILRYFVESPDPVLFTAELAEKMEMTTEGVRHRLNNLVERGLLRTKKPGHRTRVYWISHEGRQYYADASEDSGEDSD